ncbi:MAG: hypothetical protein ACI9P5_003712 [Saprospiraceae bacterium]|jgi:hypothetical protein|tara:strand:+ start:124 stop:807 length:684 start_codon:yes stop_codon:yes gene_type:complete
MGVLNSIKGIVIRGENYDFCFHLYKSYKAILDTKNQVGKKSQNPFYGSDLIDENQLLKDYSQLIKNVLLSKHLKNSSNMFKNITSKEHIYQNIKCFGFKEVRYERHLGEFEEYLSFLEKIFPIPCYVFNTRNREDVLKSMKAVDFYTEKPFDLNYLKTIEDAFQDYINGHPNNTFHISYEDVVTKSEKLKELFTFIGVTCSEQQIDKVLSLRHSYSPAQQHVRKLQS